MSKELAAAIHAQEEDLVAYSKWHEVPQPTIREVQKTLDEHGPQRPIRGVFQQAADTVSSPKDAEKGIECAAHELTRKTLELTVRDDALPHTTIGEYYWDACLQAEPRFVHSLAQHELPETIEEPDSTYAAPLVLFDTHDEPFAYQKDNGTDTVLAWRDAQYKTEGGEVWIPGGGIFVVTWNGDYPSPAIAFNKAGVVAVHSVEPDFAYLRRMSTWSTLEEIREAGAQLGLDATPYDETTDGVMGCDLETFGKRVCGLLDDAKHITDIDMTKRT